MKWLITGCAGFVGKKLTSYLRGLSSADHIVGIDILPDFASKLLDSYFAINMADLSALDALLEANKPDYIVHLASFSSVAYSWQYPAESFTNNTNIFLNLLESIRKHVPKVKLLSVGSSEEYGVVSELDLPLAEEHQLKPASPYAVARVAQEQLSRVYAQAYGMDIICTRSFNHIGPGQSENFVVSGLAKRFALFSLGKTEAITIGNTAIIRDFLDVQDVLNAYLCLIMKGKSGEVYNVCSGNGTSIKELLDMFGDICNAHPLFVQDPSLLRPVENPIVIGSHKKLLGITGWQPKINLIDSLQSVYDYWMENV